MSRRAGVQTYFWPGFHISCVRFLEILCLASRVMLIVATFGALP